MELETRKNDFIILKFNRKRTVPITIFLRALAAVEDSLPGVPSPLTTGSDEELLELFGDVDNNPDRMYIASTLHQEPAREGGASSANSSTHAVTPLPQLVTTGLDKSTPAASNAAFNSALGLNVPSAL